MAAKKPVVLVTGATGAQGGSVVSALLETGKYRVHGLTRDPSSARAKELASKGVEIVKGNLSVEADIEKALRGVDIAWIVTNFWDPSIVGQDPDEEQRQGERVAKIAEKVGLNWLIYSSLSDTGAESGGKYNGVKHFIGKHKVEELCRQLAIPNVTFVYPSFYASNVGAFVPLFEKNDGKNSYVELAIPIVKPDTKIPVVDAATDVGPVVARIIMDGAEKWKGKRIPVAGEYITPQGMVDVMTKVTGKEYRFRSLTEEETKKEAPFLASEESFHMFGWFKDYGYYGKDPELRDISIAKHLHPSIQTFEQYWRKRHESSS